MEEYYVITKYNNKDYKFRVQKSNSYSFEMLKIGGKTFCVEFKWDKPENGVELQWLDVGEKMHCEVMGLEIKKDTTVLLLNTSVEILKTYITNQFKFIHFLDNSKFYCMHSIYL